MAKQQKSEGPEVDPEDLEQEPKPGDPDFAPAPPQVDETPQGTEPRDPNPVYDPPRPEVEQVRPTPQRPNVATPKD